MKKIIIIILLLQSSVCFADNPIDQYCGAEQYGYLFNGKLYTAPNGQGWEFPQPNGSQWHQTRTGYSGANVYRLDCGLDDLLPSFAILFGIYAYYIITKKIKENQDGKSKA